MAGIGITPETAGYFLIIDGERRGPYQRTELPGKMGDRSCLVWRSGLSQWLPAERVEELQDLMPLVPPAPGLLVGDYDEPPPVPPGTGGQWDTTAYRVGTGISVARDRARLLWRNFRDIDLRREVWPLDRTAAAKLAGDPSFWAVLLLTSLPLCFTQLNNPQHALLAFAIFFAGIWGVVFRFSIVRNVSLSIRWLVGTFFLTGLIGCPLTLVAYMALPGWYESSHAFVRLIGYVGIVGLLEESVKLIPVVLVAFALRKRLDYSGLVMAGVCSGLGFAAFENLGYFHLVGQAGAIGTFSGEEVDEIVLFTAQQSIFVALVRSISTTFGHAVWSGILSHFLAVGLSGGAKRVPLWLYGLAIVSVLHGFYNWFFDIQGVLSIVVVVLSFMLLRIYLLQGVVSMGATPEPPPVGAVEKGDLADEQT